MTENDDKDGCHSADMSRITSDLMCAILNKRHEVSPGTTSISLVKRNTFKESHEVSS